MKSTAFYEKLWLLTLAFTLACMLAFYVVNDIYVGNLVQIQFADNLAMFKELVGGHGLGIVRNNHYFDFFFIGAYTALFTVTLKLVVTALDFSIRKQVYLLCFVPGFLDILENFFFLMLLADRDSCFTGYFWAARAKWGVTIVYLQLLLAILLFYGLLNLNRGYLWAKLALRGKAGD